MAAYRACQPALVMLSNAIYPALDPQAPAVLSSKIIHGVLRGKLGFAGVTISDSLAAPGVAGPATAVRQQRPGSTSCSTATRTCRGARTQSS